MSHDEALPLIDELSARYLATVINRLAESFDVTTLSADETAAIFLLLDRLFDSLWRAHSQVLLPFIEEWFARFGDAEDEETNEPNGSGGTTH